jgi:hypothetical protein
MYYVTMTDKFLSGWGMARNKTAKLVIECETYAEAEIVKENALNRTDTKNVSIRTTRPAYPVATHYTDYHNKTSYEKWFEPGYFKRD